jgi:hypothetical protein
MATEIQFKSFTASEWTTNQELLGNVPILIKGETGYESDTGKFKIGDGINIWSALAYFQSGAGSSSNSFTTISTTSGTFPVATSSTDTLTLTAGTGITITGNSATDTITIASTITDTNTTYDLTSTGTSTASINLVPSSGATDSVTITGSGATSVSHSSGAITISSTAYTLPKATSSALGGVELFDATVQTVAANSVTTTASRTYGAQLNSNDQLVINVPWTDTDTNTFPTTWTWTDGTTVGPTASITGTSSTITVAAIPSASVSVAGIITTGAQTFSGVKTFTAPVLGAATATTINKVTLTAPATGSTLTIADGKTLTASNTLTFSGTDTSTLNIGTGGTLGTGAFATIANYAELAGATFTGNIAINNSTSTAITTTGTTAAIFNTGATTLNIGGAATTINFGVSGGVINFASSVVLRAGGTAANTAPLYFSASSSVLTTPVAGTMEYNNANFLATPFTTSGRALIESNYFYSNQSSVTVAGTSTGGAAISGSVFGLALPLATSTAYQIEATLYLQTSYSTNAPTSQSVTFSYPTGTTILAEGIIVQNIAAATTLSTAGSFYAMQQNTNRTLTVVTASGNWHRVSMRGIIRTSTTAGSFSINFGGTNGATPATLTLTLGADSFIKLTPVGSATSSNSFGAWA